VRVCVRVRVCVCVRVPVCVCVPVVCVCLLCVCVCLCVWCGVVLCCVRARDLKISSCRWLIGWLKQRSRSWVDRVSNRWSSFVPVIGCAGSEFFQDTFCRTKSCQRRDPTRRRRIFHVASARSRCVTYSGRGYFFDKVLRRAVRTRVCPSTVVMCAAFYL